MAKKARYSGAQMTGAIASEYKPRVHVDLEPGQAEGLTVGKKATIVLKGKVVMVEEREEILDYGPDKGKKTYRCAVCLEDPDVKVASPGLYEELAEEEDE